MQLRSSRRILKYKGDFSQLIYDLVDYKKASQERNPSCLLPSFASEKSHYHKISSP